MDSDKESANVTVTTSS